MDRIGIDCLSVFGLPPVAFVELAADLGCRHVSIGLKPTGANLSGFPDWSLRERGLRRDMVSALGDRGVAVSLGEGLAVLPGIEVGSYAADLDAMREIGTPRIATVSLDPDMVRTLEQFAELAEMAAALDIATVVEFVPGFTIANLAQAVAAIRHMGLATSGILVDCMHLFRSGGSVADIAALEPAMIGYVQFCDVPLLPAHSNYLAEAMFERMIPGHGELPLLDVLAAIPPSVILGLEIPRRARLEAGEGDAERLAPCVAAARSLLAQAAAA